MSNNILIPVYRELGKQVRENKIDLNNISTEHKIIVEKTDVRLFSHRDKDEKSLYSAFIIRIVDTEYYADFLNPLFEVAS